jgi:hypothetical protein
MIIIAMLFAMSVLLFNFSPSANAQGSGNCEDEKNQSFLGIIPTWYKYLDVERDTSGRCSPVLSGNDAGEKVNSALPIGLAVLEAMIRLAGIVAVAMIFFGGFKYITSQGSPDAAAAGRKTVINAIIGLILVVLSTSLISFVGNNLS